jgi:tetratricopeptide (TPR) repeat protein
LPNEPLTHLLLGYIDRRQGNWNESIRNMEHAVELDPRNPQTAFVLQQIAKTHECLRQYPSMMVTLRRALELDPQNPVLRVQLARVSLDARADPEPMKSMMRLLLSENPESATTFASQWLFLALCERDASAASRALAFLPRDGCYEEAITFPRGWCEGQAARLRGDAAEANRAFSQARAEVALLVNEQPENGPAVCALGVLDAALGQKENAIREGRRALTLLPVQQDSINGALLIEYLGLIYALSGETDAAVGQLETAAKIPGYLNYGQLWLDPLWDPIRNDERFQKIAASLARP